MDLTSLLNGAVRVLDVGVEDSDLAVWLSERGHERYLGLVRPDRLASLRASAPGLEQRFQPLTSVSQTHRNSTNLLILRPAYAHSLWMVSPADHDVDVAVGLPGPAGGAELLAAVSLGALRGRLRPLGTSSFGSQRFLVLRAHGRGAPRPRRYLAPHWGVDGLVRRLEDAGLEYAVLRWFDSLPELEPGEDLDVLVADQHLDKLTEILAEEPGTIPVDVYSETGLPGADYKGVAYYPPRLARQLLERVVTHRSGCRVPAPADHLRSLAYHAVYHKGGRSGLPSGLLGSVDDDPEHDYAAVLCALADELGDHLEPTLEGVDDYLGREGWRPPPDTLRRLAETNPWIRARFAPEREPDPHEPQLATFFVRERALAVLTQDELCRELDHAGFDVLAVRKLDEAARARCASSARGGNWGRGPYPRSGGAPALAAVALHHAPLPPTARQRRLYPRLANAQVLLAKLRIRDLVALRVEPAYQFNAMHSSDTESEAWEYVELALPEEAGELRDEVARRRKRYATDAAVVRTLHRGPRAKVEVVAGDSGVVVRKTFAEGYLRHLHREVEAIGLLADSIAAAPELVTTGSNWFELAYYPRSLTPSRGRLVPLRTVRGVLEVLRQLHALGLDLVDAKPSDFVLDAAGRLRIVDLEYLHRYEGSPPAFAGSYSFVGVPDSFAGDAPSGWSYDRNWRRTTGLSRASLVSGSLPRQHLERSLFRLRLTAAGLSTASRAVAGAARRTARTARRTTGHGYARWTRRRVDGGR